MKRAGQRPVAVQRRARRARRCSTSSNGHLGARGDLLGELPGGLLDEGRERVVQRALCMSAAVRRGACTTPARCKNLPRPPERAALPLGLHGSAPASCASGCRFVVGARAAAEPSGCAPVPPHVCPRRARPDRRPRMPPLLLLAAWCTGRARRATWVTAIPLQRGMSGHDVKILQDALTRLGRPVPPDGDVRPADAARRCARGSAPRTRRVNGRVDRGDLPGLRARVRFPVTRRRCSARRRRSTPTARPTPPAGAPQVVADLFTAANRIATLPYRYGGGHKSLHRHRLRLLGLGAASRCTARGCSTTTMDSTMLESFGDAGPGAVDHDLRQRRPHVPDGRRRALRHQRAERRPARAGSLLRAPRRASWCATRRGFRRRAAGRGGGAHGADVEHRRLRLCRSTASGGTGPRS